MNEHLQERFRKGRQIDHHGAAARAEVVLLAPRLNPRVSKYYEDRPATGGSWLSRPEVPTSEEVMDTDTLGGASSTSDIVELAPNRPHGPFESKEEYLSIHYELLREDAVKPLRDAVARMRQKPNVTEDAFDGQIGIYDKTHICGVITSTRGIAHRVTFSLFRTGKKILWEQSKRLISGSLVVLTPKDDMFKKKAIVATVAARPLDGLRQNPPQIDLFFARAEESEIDPAVQYVMIEERSGYFEADRHTLSALQHMMTEPFPLQEHLVGVKSNVSDPPKYLLDNPKKDLRSMYTGQEDKLHENVDVLSNWPSTRPTNLDASQMAAVRSILTKRLAAIQGPPGTGKTFVSVLAIQVMLANRAADDPPIIIVCQTNHAIDQILRYIAPFEEKFVRLGGRSKDRDIIKKRTMYMVRQETSLNPPPGWAAGMAKKRMAELEKEIGVLLTPLQSDKKPLSHRMLENLKLLTKTQADSLEAGASRWVQHKKTHVIEARTPFTVWLSNKLVPVPPKQMPEEFGFDFEEVDLEFEQLKELEAENGVKDEDDFETLIGRTYDLADNFTCHKISGVEGKVKELLKKEQDMWKIPESIRPAIYRYLQAQQKSHILTEFRKKSHAFNDQTLKRKIGYWEKDENILKEQHIIGMTTTGFSKYRALISALQPKIVLVEEAAETLEALVTVTCVPSLQQLILVGDHLQLRPHAHVKAHEQEPFHLDVSLFERMVNNNIPCDILTKQRRMIPEIRRILYPIYRKDIQDHPSVLDPSIRPDVPGMGGVNSLFFSHQWAEQRDDEMSCFNRTEAEMIVGFYLHLLHNGMDIGDITILTFYNGQRKRILSELRERVAHQEAKKFKVVTVDSYQGEENKVVILSLVRSNRKGQIGFLDVKNRVCVALSRAQCGFYMFGNGRLLFNNSKTWRQVIMIMAGRETAHGVPNIQGSRLLQSFPTMCSKHKRAIDIVQPSDWENLVGGCNLNCEDVLPCGHRCELKCHPFSHADVNCQRCRSKKNEATDTEALSKSRGSRSSIAQHSNSTSTSSWNSFAVHEERRRINEIQNYKSMSQPLLLDVAVVDQGVKQLGLQLDGTTGLSSQLKVQTESNSASNQGHIKNEAQSSGHVTGAAVRKKDAETWKSAQVHPASHSATCIQSEVEDLITLD